MFFCTFPIIDYANFKYFFHRLCALREQYLAVSHHSFTTSARCRLCLSYEIM